MQIIAEFSVKKWTQEESWALSGMGQHKNSAVGTATVSSVEPWEGVRDTGAAWQCSCVLLRREWNAVYT